MSSRKIFSRAAIFLTAALMVVSPAAGQTRIGTVQGTIKDPDGALVSGATVTITQPNTGYTQTAQTDEQGVYKLVNIPFSDYNVRTEAAGFQATEQHIDVESAVPLNLDISLAVGTTAQTVTIEADPDHAEHDRVSSDTDINQTILERQAGAAPSRGIEAIVASAPGFAPDDNGRLHPRGSESQVQYVVDGVPITDNLSAIFSTSLDARTLRTVEVMTGGIPAEFGDKLAGVINVNTRSGTGDAHTRRRDLLRRKLFDGRSRRGFLYTRQKVRLSDEHDGQHFAAFP